MAGCCLCVKSRKGLYCGQGSSTRDVQGDSRNVNGEYLRKALTGLDYAILQVCHFICIICK